MSDSSENGSTEIESHNRKVVEELLTEARAYLEEMLKHPKLGTADINIILTHMMGDDSGKFQGSIRVQSSNSI